MDKQYINALKEKVKKMNRNIRFEDSQKCFKVLIAYGYNPYNYIL